MTESERHAILQALAYSESVTDDAAEAAYDELERMWRERVTPA